MKKLYYAYVTKNVIDSFEEKLAELEAKVKVVHASPAVSEDGESIVFYVLEADEGVINSKWELK